MEFGIAAISIPSCALQRRDNANADSLSRQTEWKNNLRPEKGEKCDSRAGAEVNWTGLTLIMFIVFVHSVKIAT